MNNIHHQCRGERPGRKLSGPTSFWVQEPEQVFDHLPMKPGMFFVDAGCGAGEYALFAASRVGEQGQVLALDCLESSIKRLDEVAKKEGVDNLSAQACDITAPLSLETDSADIILLSTVLHIKAVRERAGAVFTEFRRVLRPGGTLAVLENQKVEADFGPPMHMRLSAEDVAELACPCGFSKSSVAYFEHTYLACFIPSP